MHYYVKNSQNRILIVIFVQFLTVSKRFFEYDSVTDETKLDTDRTHTFFSSVKCLQNYLILIEFDFLNLILGNTMYEFPCRNIFFHVSHIL